MHRGAYPFENVLQYFGHTTRLSVFSTHYICIAASWKSYLANLWKIIQPCRFFLPNHFFLIFHENILILVKIVQISMKLEYISYTKWPYPKSVYENYVIISLGKSLLISGNRQNMGENLTQLHRLSWILGEIDLGFLLRLSGRKLSINLTQTWCHCWFQI